MRLLLPLLATTIACGGSAKTPRPAVKQELSEKDILQRSTPAIVRIEAGDQLGTGFIVDQSGLVATNLHVVSGKKEIKIKLHDGAVYPVLAIAGIDPGRDLAVVRIKPTSPMPTLRLGDSSAMVPGDKIIAIGNPLGVFDYSISNGLVSQVRPVCTREQVELHVKNRARFEELAQKPNRTEAEEGELEQLRCPQELTLLQISAPISQGSSGGPLFNQAGEVVGVTTAIITGGQNINLAIPANYLKPIVAKPGSITMEDFAARTASLGGGDTPADKGPRIVRNVPTHPTSVFDGCNGEQIAELVKNIWEAIEVGAPLYNQGNHEACFKIYEGTATKYERDAKCKGVRTAFGEGRTRIEALATWKEKAWAMRDTFDGLLDAADRWAKASGKLPPKK